jgi:hypothetical protein
MNCEKAIPEIAKNVLNFFENRDDNHCLKIIDSLVIKFNYPEFYFIFGFAKTYFANVIDINYFLFFQIYLQLATKSNNLINYLIMFIAIRNRNIDLLTAILNLKSINIDYIPSGYVYTILCCAAMANAEDMCILLIDRGADPFYKCFVRDLDVVSAAHNAVSNVNFKVMKKIAVYYEQLLEKQPNFKHEHQESIVEHFGMGIDSLCYYESILSFLKMLKKMGYGDVVKNVLLRKHNIDETDFHFFY